MKSRENIAQKSRNACKIKLPSLSHFQSSLGVIQVSGQSGSESDSVLALEMGQMEPRKNDATALLFFEHQLARGCLLLSRAGPHEGKGRGGRNLREGLFSTQGLLCLPFPVLLWVLRCGSSTSGFFCDMCGPAGYLRAPHLK
jgi:hypothetical protein